MHHAEADDQPNIIKVDFTNKRRLPEADRADLPQIKREEVTRKLQLLLSAEHSVGTFWDFCNTFDPGWKKTEDINRAMTLLGNHFNFLPTMRGYRKGDSYRQIMSSHHYNNMDTAELAEVMDAGDNEWRLRPQFFHAIATILDGKIWSEVGENLRGKSVSDFAQMLGSSPEQWQKNYRHYYVIALMMSCKIHLELDAFKK